MVDRYIPRLQIDITAEQQMGLQKFPKGSRTIIFGLITDQLLEMSKELGIQKVFGGIISGRIKLEITNEEK